jgi:hypothetical protein
MKAFLLERLKEPSTIRGLIWLVSAFGIYNFTSNQENAIVALGMALAGAGGLLPDDLSKMPTRRQSRADAK